MEVGYFSHVVSEEGAETDPAKLQALTKFSLLNNAKAVLF